MPVPHGRERAAARGGRTRGETRSFSPLANHPFSFRREQAHRHLPKDWRHLLPQIRARCARKVRNTQVPAAHLPKATRRADSTPRGRTVQPVVGARIARPRPGAATVPLTLIWQPGGSRKASLTLARAARPKGKRVIDKRGKPFGCPPLARSAAAQAAFPPAKSGHTRLPCWAHHKIQPFSA